MATELERLQQVKEQNTTSGAAQLAKNTQRQIDRMSKPQIRNTSSGVTTLAQPTIKTGNDYLGNAQTAIQSTTPVVAPVNPMEDFNKKLAAAYSPALSSLSTQEQEAKTALDTFKAGLPSKQEQERTRILGLVDQEYKPKQNALGRSIQSIETDASLEAARRGTARGSREFDRETIRRDIDTERRNALAAEQQLRADILIRSSEGADESELEGLGNAYNAAVNKRKELEGAIAQIEQGLTEKAAQNTFELQKLGIQNQQAFDLEKKRAENETAKILLENKLNPSQASEVAQELSQSLGYLMRKDGTFVTNEKGEKISIPKTGGGSLSSGGSVAIPQGIYAFQTTPGGGIQINAQEGQQAGQCGQFVNDILGMKVFGDSFEQKKSTINSATPIAGAAFIMKTGESYGHVGLVESVNFDGSLNVVDSNFYNKSRPETVSRRTIKRGTPEYNSIAGYYIPPSAITEKDVVLSQIRNGGITPTEISKIREQASQGGWLQELNNELNNPKNKLVGEKMATQFMTDTSMTNNQFDELLQRRQELGFGNKAFQGVGQKDIEGFNQFIELGSRLRQAKEVWDEYKNEGGGLSGVWDGPTRLLGRAADASGIKTTKETELYRKLQALTGDSLSQYIQSISGAAVSEQEFQRLAQNKPNVTMTDSQFENELNRMISDYNASTKSKVGRYGFEDDIQLKDAISRYGQMPTNLGEIDSSGSQDDEFLASLGFDSTTDDIYTNIFSSPR